jgi:hypothetical protein
MSAGWRLRLADQARRRIEEISQHELARQTVAREPVIIDVCESEEYAEG